MNKKIKLHFIEYQPTKYREVFRYINKKKKQGFSFHCPNQAHCSSVFILKQTITQKLN